MNFEIVTAVTPDYVDVLYWSAPSWTIKPQFADKPLLVYHHGFGGKAENDWNF